MIAPCIIGKLSVAIAVVIIWGILPALPAAALETVFEMRARDGSTITADPMQKLVNLMDAENSVRIGVESGPAYGSDTVPSTASLWFSNSETHSLLRR